MESSRRQNKSSWRKLGAFPQVSHCYERPVYPDWPYNVFSMIHCKSIDEAKKDGKRYTESD